MPQFLKKSSQIKIKREHENVLKNAQEKIVNILEDGLGYDDDDEFWNLISDFLCIDERFSEKKGCNFFDNLRYKNPKTAEYRLENLLSPQGNTPVADGNTWLGSYHSISSPGKITLNISALQVFFFSVLREIIIHKKHKINEDDFWFVALLTVYKTYFHELFHHFSDVYGSNRQGKTATPPASRRDQLHWDYEVEETLAVASSRHITGLFGNGSVLCSEFFVISYEYTSRGYKDWKNYPSYSEFRKGIVDYFKIEAKLSHPKYNHLEDMLEHMFVALINNPFAEIVLI